MPDIVVAFAFLIGFITATFTILILLETGHTKYNKPNPIVYKTNTGIVCKVDKYYPKTNCKLIYKDMGPRLSTLKVKE